MSNELRGTFECPICGWPKPHTHSEEEISQRPWIAGARSSFEKEAREFMAGSYFKGVRTGYWWAQEADRARGQTKGEKPFEGSIYYDWAHRKYPQGPYTHEFVEVMWQFWRMAWGSARGVKTIRPDEHNGDGK